MIHLIAFARISGKQYAYDYIVKDKDIKKIIQRKQEILGKLSSEAKSLMTFHVISNECVSFNEIATKDPYFADSKPFSNWIDFVREINSQTNINSSDIASYLLRKYPALRNHRFVLHKVLYYIYADFLTSYGLTLFMANFVAFDKGPVEYDIYRLEKYEKSELMKNSSFEIKVQYLTNYKEVLHLIKRDVEKYQNYYDQVWNRFESSDSTSNLTHKKGTPWSRAYERGTNSPIIDSDIIQYHHIEVLN